MFSKLKNTLGLIVLFALIMVFYMPALSMAQTYYSTTTATLGDANSAGNYRMTVTSDGVVHYAFDTGILLPYTTASTNATLTAAQTGTTVIFNNLAGTAGNLVTFTLPVSAVGMQYTVIADIAKSFRIKPNSADIINYSTAIAGSKINNGGSAIAGDNITLFCATAGQWSIKSKVGTWTVDNNP